VELEVVLPAEMSVREAHDISLALQQSIEQLDAVERAFVHGQQPDQPGSHGGRDTSLRSSLSP